MWWLLPRVLTQVGSWLWDPDTGSGAVQCAHLPVTLGWGESRSPELGAAPCAYTQLLGNEAQRALRPSVGGGGVSPDGPGKSHAGTFPGADVPSLAGPSASSPSQTEK